MHYAKGDGLTVPEGGITPLFGTMAAIVEKRGKLLHKSL